MTDSTDKRYPGGLLLMDLEGNILDAPLFFSEALEFADQDSPTVFELFSVKRTPRLTINRVVATASGEREFHATVQREDAEALGFRYWDVTAGPGGPVAFYVVDDTSVIKSHEWRLKRLRRSLLNDAHDFVAGGLNRHLGTLKALAEVLRDDPESAAEAGERILEAVEALSESVDAFASHFQLPENEPDDDSLVRVVDLPTVISSWSDKMVKVECTIDNVEKSAFITTVVVERILSALVTNAIESRPSDGTVRVAIQGMRDRVSFEVSDKGRGMTKHELSRAEDPFFTTKRGHSGIGLSSARQALRSAGGYWNYTSSRRKGTRVRVVIPID